MIVKTVYGYYATSFCYLRVCVLTQGYCSKDIDDFKSGSNPANASLIKRFNHHSTMVLKSCDKKSVAAAATTTTNAAASAETGVQRLPKEVTVNGGIHVHPVTSTQNSVVVSSSPAAVTSNDEVVDKHVRNIICWYLKNFYHASA